MAKPRSYLSWWIWLIYLILFGIAVPWYWPSGSERTWFGFPAWAVVAVAGSFAISSFTAWLWLCRWPEDEESGS